MSPAPLGLVPAVEAAFAGDPGRPAVTFYDDATGERVELSWTSLGNWAAKTANLLRFELGLQPGDTVGVALPLHWQTVAVVLGCWWSGATVEPAGVDDVLPTDGEAVFCRGDRLQEALDAGAPEAIGLSLAPMGARMPAAEVPPEALDYAVGVPGQGDRWAPDFSSSPEDEITPGLTRAELSPAGLGPRDRVLVTSAWPEQLLTGLVGPLLAGAGVVLVAHPTDAASLARHAGTERCTVTVGCDVPGLPRLDAADA